MPSSANSINNTVGASISGVTNTLTVQNPSNTASSQAQCLLTVGGTTSLAPWCQWTVGTTESFALGQNNSATQKLYLNYTNSATINPTTGTNMFIFDQSVPGMVLAAGVDIVFNTAAGAVGTAANNGYNIHEVGTFTPTLVGAAVAGTTTYTTQTAVYTRFGDQVYIIVNIVITGATGTGDATLGNFPFTIQNNTLDVGGSGRITGAGWAWPASRTMAALMGNNNTVTAIWNSVASSQTNSTIQMSNAAANHQFSLLYQI